MTTPRSGNDDMPAPSPSNLYCAASLRGYDGEVRPGEEVHLYVIPEGGTHPVSIGTAQIVSQGGFFLGTFNHIDLDNVSDEATWVVVEKIDVVLDKDLGHAYPYAAPGLFPDDASPETMDDIDPVNRHPWDVAMLGVMRDADRRPPETDAESPPVYRATANALMESKGMSPGMVVELLYPTPTWTNQQPIRVGTGTIFPGGDNALQFAVDGRETWTLGTEVRGIEGQHLVVIYNATFSRQYHSFPNLYCFATEETAQPSTLGEYKPGLRSVWPVELMQVLPAAASEPSPPPQPPAAQAQEHPGAEDVSEIQPVQAPGSPRAQPSAPVHSAPGTPLRKRDSSPGTPLRKRPISAPKPQVLPVTLGPAGTSEIAPSMLSIQEINYQDVEYQRIRVMVKLSSIQILDKTLRSTDRPNVDSIKGSVIAKGIDPSLGIPTITIKCEHDGTTVLDHVRQKPEERINNLPSVVDPNHLVDGGHRVVGYNEISYDPKVPKHRKDELEYIECVLMWRVDGKDMANSEILDRGAELNQGTSRSKKMDLGDTLHGVTSSLEVRCQESNISSADFAVKANVGDTAGKLANASILNEVGARQKHKYVGIALAAMRNSLPIPDLMILSSRHGVNVGVTQISNPIVLALDRIGMELAIDTVGFYMKNVPNRGKFEDIEHMFWEHFRDYYAEVRTLAVRFENEVRDVKNLLTLQMEFGAKGNFMSVRNAFVTTVGKFQFKLMGGKPSSKTVRSWEQKRTRFVNTVVRHFTGKQSTKKTAVLPLPPKTLPDRKRTRTTRLEPKTARTPPKKPKGGKKRKTAPPRGKDPKKSRKDGSFQATEKVGGVKYPQPASDGESVPSTVRDDDSDYYNPDVYDAGLFDDIPNALLPFGFLDLDPDRSFPRTSPTPFLAYATMPPSSWGRVNCIIHTEPWVRALYIPPRHNANWLTAEELMKVHHLVFYHGARCRHQEIRSCSRPALGVVFPKTKRNTPNTALTWSHESKPYVAARDMDVLACEFFAAKRIELTRRGFCMMPGFLTDEHFPKDLFSDVLLDEDGDVFNSLVNYFMDSFPGVDKMKDEDNWKLWRPIINTGDPDSDAKMRTEGRCRFSTTKDGMIHFEDNPDLAWVVKKRALLDARIGQVIRAMNLDPAVAPGWYDPEMTVPRTGGRFLLTGEGCPRQTTHQDFPTRSSMEKCPGYFALATGMHSTPIWACENSHLYVFGTAKEIRAFSKAAKLKKIIIPPYSLFIGRGDLTHAGAGFGDSSVPNGLLRYHIYFAPRGVRIEDGVHRIGIFRPRFEEGERARPQSPPRDGHQPDDDDASLHELENPTSDNGEETSEEQGEVVQEEE